MTRTHRRTPEHRTGSTTDRATPATTDRRGDPITDRRAPGEPMAEVSHTHPYADRGALAALFERGPTVAADGGRRDAGPPDDSGRDASEDSHPENGEDDGEATDYAADETADRPRMRDVDHTPPHDGGDGVDRVFERGGTEDPVEIEE